jgi:hypothetical protein
MMQRVLKLTMRWVPAAVLAVGCLWAVGALYFDFPVRVLRVPAAVLLVVAMVVARVRWRREWVRWMGAWLVMFGVVLGWWLTLKPSHERVWQADVVELPWAEVEGDVVTVHNIRNCDYRSVSDYTVRWETRAYRLSRLTGVSLAINYWGSPYMAHPIASFEFADMPPLAFSIETRKEVGEGYSAVGGLYRQFELVCLAADERDVLRVRTNYREGEDVYFYHLNMKPEAVRERFMEYLATMNGIRETPRWYNAVTTNCTTAIRAQRPAAERLPWDWRVLVNGYGDEMLYELGAIDRGMPFGELRAKSRINGVAREAGDAPDFSVRIRAGLPGYGGDVGK